MNMYLYRHLAATRFSYAPVSRVPAQVPYVVRHIGNAGRFTVVLSGPDKLQVSGLPAPAERVMLIVSDKPYVGAATAFGPTIPVPADVSSAPVVLKASPREITYYFQRYGAGILWTTSIGAGSITGPLDITLCPKGSYYNLRDGRCHAIFQYRGL